MITTATEQVLAKVPPKSLNDFIKVLYVAAASVAAENVNKDLTKEANAWVPGAKVAEAAIGVPVIPSVVSLLKGGAQSTDDYVPVFKALRKALKLEVNTDPAIGHTQVDQLNALTGYLVSNSEQALRKVTALAPATGEQSIVAAFVFKAASQTDYIKPLEKIVKAATGRKGQVLTAEEGKALAASHPTVYKEYLRLRKAYNIVWKDELRNLVVESGKNLLDYDKVLAYMAKKDIKHTLPPGFHGLIDANGKLYTTAGKEIANVPGVGFSVVMNPDYNAKTDNGAVFTTVNGQGKVSGYIYTIEYKQKTTKEKFEKVKALDAVLDKVKKKWIGYMKLGDTSPACMMSTMLELLYAFSARIGSMGNAAGGQATYGISTLLVGHIHIKGTGLVIDYQGKDNVRQVHKVLPSSPVAKMLINNIKLYCEGKQRKDFVFSTMVNGKVDKVTGGEVNRWFQTLGAPVTVHKLRHVRGTELFQQLLDANEDKIFGRKTPLTQAQADEMFKQLAVKVGAMLGHVRGVGEGQKVTPMTAVQNYISPELMIGFYDRLGLRPPKFLSKFVD